MEHKEAAADARLVDLSLVVFGTSDGEANDRAKYDAAALRELAGSMAEHGLRAPIWVRPVEETGLFQVVAGHRRTLAARLLGWESIPALVYDVTAGEAAALMMLENTARVDLDPVDEARAYDARVRVWGWSVEDVAKTAGVSLHRVQARLKLLRLRPDVLDLVRAGGDNGLSLGYAAMMADAALDSNRQLVALARLRENASPTPGWFRRVVGELAEQQASASLFDLPMWGGAAEVVASVQTRAEVDAEPPLPTTRRAPVRGQGARALVRSQMEYWEAAAVAWDGRGKSRERDECLAAAAALSGVLAVLPADPVAVGRRDAAESKRGGLRVAQFSLLGGGPVVTVKGKRRKSA